MNFKKLLFQFFVCLFVFSSCEDAQDISKNTFITQEALRKAVQVYNQSLSTGDHRGLILEGNIEISHFESEDFYLEFLVSNSNLFRKYDFQYSKDMGEIKMPSRIEHGQVTYLGDNLVIQDLDKQETYVFVVETFQNRIDGSNPYLGIGIGSQIYKDKISLRSSSGSCSCDCKKCFGNCEFNCGSATASCSCGGNTQSKTCRSCYNAECTQCDENEM